MIALHQVRAVALTGYVEVARFVSLDPFEMLRKENLGAIFLNDPEFRIPASNVAQLLELSAQASGCESFGLLMAECRTFESIGPLGLLLQHLGSLRETLEAIVKYRRLLTDIVDLFITESDDEACIEIVVLPKFVGDQVISLVLAMIHIVLTGASRHSWKPRAVHFHHKAPEDLTVYKRVFGTDLCFESPINGFSCDRVAMDRPWPWANGQMAKNAIRLLDHADVRQHESTINDQVTRAIALLLPVGRATLEEIAARFDSSTRAMQRVLEKEGTSFGELLTKARRELATRYLGNRSQSISSVAELIGYSSTSSFTRWFDGEFGVSPTNWRNSLFDLSAPQAA